MLHTTSLNAIVKKKVSHIDGKMLVLPQRGWKNHKSDVLEFIDSLENVYNKSEKALKDVLRCACHRLGSNSTRYLAYLQI